ncbi:MAG: OadG family protein [Clostridia bacterium]|nr:OadG family protein [Clostridia bacterium]
MLQNLNFLSTDWSLGINVTITGLVVVFGMLLLLVVVLYLFGAFFDKTPKKEKPVQEKVEKKPAPKANTIAPAVTSNNPNAVSDEIVAVIAAAVASMYEGSNVKPVIRRITKTGNRTRPAWTSAGIFENTRSF